MKFSLHTLRYLKRAPRIYLNRLLGREYVRKDFGATIEISGLCNLLCVFCAYPEKEIGKQVLTLEQFSNLVNQLVDLGYDHLGLTPQTGDVFVDKNFHEKLEFLEQHDGIRKYEFITNLISAPHSTLDIIARSKKLLHMHISIYGSDSETFQKVTRRPELQYRRLVDNLNYLAKIGPDINPGIGTFTMTYRDFNWSPYDPPSDDDSELMKALRAMSQSIPGYIWTGNHVDFDSWGGKITQQMLDDLDLGFDLVGPTVPMVGPCSMLFGGFVILADGNVNACACRAVDRSLVIGNTNEQPLYEIISPANPAHKEILRRHMAGDYPDACKDCKIFGSVYRRPRGRNVVSVKEILKIQQQRCDNARSIAPKTD